MKNIHNRFYPALIIALCAFTYLLNFCNKISDCALVFTCLALTTNIISEFYGLQKAMRSMMLSIIIGFCLLWNLNYYISGRVINGLQIASFLSLFLSTYFSATILIRLKEVYSFPLRNFISLITSAITDGFIMSGFLAYHFSLGKVFSIFCKELSFKCFYSSLLCLAIYFGIEATRKKYSSK